MDDTLPSQPSGPLPAVKAKPAEPRRYGMALRIKPERLEEYSRLHAAVWPGVLERIFASAVKNHSVYYRDGWVFSYLEYWGDDFEADMRLMAVDLEMRRWWALTEPMQEPIPSRAPGEWWARMEEIFHHD